MLGTPNGWLSRRRGLMPSGHVSGYEQEPSADLLCGFCKEVATSVMANIRLMAMSTWGSGGGCPSTTITISGLPGVRFSCTVPNGTSTLTA